MISYPSRFLGTPQGPPQVQDKGFEEAKSLIVRGHGGSRIPYPRGIVVEIAIEKSSLRLDLYCTNFDFGVGVQLRRKPSSVRESTLLQTL